jgi:hypothetical protein
VTLYADALLAGMAELLVSLEPKASLRNDPHIVVDVQQRAP